MGKREFYKLIENLYYESRVEDINNRVCYHCGENPCISIKLTGCGYRVTTTKFNFLKTNLFRLFIIADSIVTLFEVHRKDFGITKRELKKIYENIRFIDIIRMKRLRLKKNKEKRNETFKRRSGLGWSPDSGPSG